MNFLHKGAIAFAIAGICSIGAWAQSNSNSTRTEASTKVTPMERAFLKEAAQGDMAEVQLGQLAQEKAAAPEVKQFAQRMVNDHTQNQDQLKQVAQQVGYTLPDQVAAKDKATKERLEKLSGKSFDHAYMLDMVRDHTQDVAKFKTEKNATTPEIKSYASQTLPTLESHLKDAKSIEPKTGRATHTSTTKTSYR